MSKSSSDTVAQEKTAFENFCKELKKSCKDHNFTKEQTETILQFAKEQEPNKASIEQIVKKCDEFIKANADAKDATAEAEKKISDAEKKLEDSEDFQDFLRILAVTEGVPEKLDAIEKAKILDKYEVWVNDGRPRPSLGDKKPKVEKILRIYRRKHKGEQYLSYVVEGKSEQVGMKTDVIYGKLPDGTEDTSLVIGHNRYPTIKYNEKHAREVLEKAKRYTEKVDLRFVFQANVITIHNEENFFGDFDGLIQKSFAREVI